MTTDMYYIATDADLIAIHGCGKSPEAAVRHAREESGDPESTYVTLPATARLVEHVYRHGGDPDATQWHVVDGHGRRIGSDIASHGTSDLDDERQCNVQGCGMH